MLSPLPLYPGELTHVCLQTPRDITLLRIALLEGNSPSLPEIVTVQLQEAMDAFLLESRTKSLQKNPETHLLQNILQFHLHLGRADIILEEELARQGSHALLKRLFQETIILASNESSDECDQDILQEMQDVCCELITRQSKYFKAMPFSRQELRRRLPLQVSTVDKKQNVLIQQVTTRQSAQHDVGFVLWPSSVVLMNWLVSNTSLKGSVLELGAGCGLAGLVTAQLDSVQQVILTDYNTAVLHNLRQNIILNGLSDKCQVVGLDFYQQSGLADQWKDIDGQFHPQVDTVLAADIICRSDDAFSAAYTIHDVLRSGGLAFVVCADAEHRFGVECFEIACLQVGLEVKVEPVQLDHSLCSSSLRMTSGYVEGMKLTLFRIQK